LVYSVWQLEAGLINEYKKYIHEFSVLDSHKHSQIALLNTLYGTFENLTSVDWF